MSVCAPAPVNGTASEDCERLYERLDGALDMDIGAVGQELSGSTDLYVTFERLFSTSHIVLTRTEGEHFTGLSKAAYGPVGSGDRNVVSSQLTGFQVLAKFVLEDGDDDKSAGSGKVKAMEWGGSVWDAGEEIAEKLENEVQVRFEKV